MERDPRYRDTPPHLSDEQKTPQPERPVPPEEQRREASPADKPSQAEGERDGRDE